MTLIEVHGTSITIQHCGGDWEGFFHRSSTILQNCTVEQVQTDTSSSITVTDCQVGLIGSKESHDIFCNNTIGEIYCTYCWNSLSNNTISNGISIWDLGAVAAGGEYWLDNNYIYGTIESVWGALDTLHLNRNVIDVRGTEPGAIAIKEGFRVYCQNNTILADGIGIRLVYNTQELIANIIMADTGVVFDGISAWFGYNLFDCQEPVAGWPMHSMPGNLQAASLLEGGSPFDYHLQPLSPAIDAGVPYLQYNDPDSTRCDIGALFYDQRLDHAPTITSAPLMDAYPDSQFAYCASAADDGDSLHFEFSGLPDWVQVPLVAYVAEELWLGGVVPSNQDVFGFTIYAYDEIGQIDSLQVQVRVIHHPLGGTLTGVLPPVEPYYTVVQDIYIPDRDTLTILPGTELRFLRAENFWSGRRILAQGTLLAEGNAQDSVIFASAELNPQDDDWQGFDFYSYWGNVGRFRYCRLSDFDGFHADKGAFSFVHCAIWGALASMSCYFQYDSDSLVIDSCEIHDKYVSISLGGNVQLSNSSLTHTHVWGLFWNDHRAHMTVRDNIFSDWINSAPFLWVRWGDEVIVEGNRFSNGHICLDLDYSYVTVRRNLFEQCELGIAFDQCFNSPSGEPSLVAQCTITDSRRGLSVSGEAGGDTLIIENNLITNCLENGITMGQYHPSDLRYNDVWGNGVNYQNCTPGAHDLSVDPEYLGLAPYEYHLMPTSPCVDAGDPAAPLDPDSTRADIGAFFYDQRNTPPQIVGWSPEVLDTVEANTSV